ncbi:isochorismatase family protein [Paracoccus sp. YIM 132242]|uniref:Isochorismatase family protein n=1 Tax=Paracoccus lichenicola TaxID=2665644 RepID=A0A6L6HTN6_9RHOB|nr:isochorismatase family cysteine hydrolase [Paracoccus lichenicola]MTE01475.1 isochorismatase family protein [Paracoccus lichenicola]
MHRIDVPPDILARAQGRRGPRSFTDMLDPTTTAHVVIDMQQGFLRPGALLEVPVAREIVGNVNRISAALRQAGGHVAFTRFAWLPDDPLDWQVFYRRFLNASEAEAQRHGFGPAGADLPLWPDMDVAPGDFVVDKTRYSAFTPGTSGLPDWLKAKGIRTLIITGTLSNCCCESTARDAMQGGYDVIFVADANATLTDYEHNAALANMMTLFADVIDTGTLLARLSSRAAA